MINKCNVAVLGSTGYVGMELVKLLSKHKYVNIKFLGSDSKSNSFLKSIDGKTIFKQLPKLKNNELFDPSDFDCVFLALPHAVSHKYVKKFFNKIKIIDLSADFRLDNFVIYKKYYGEKHSCPQYLNKFVYGLPEINKNKITKSNYIAVPGWYPTSILTPLIPLLKSSLIKPNNIIIDSKSGYSGAGKKFDIKNMFLDQDLNFYNYNTNEHRHMSEIYQELKKSTKNKINFSFNPHILPNFRGMMSTIYCDLNKNVSRKKIIKFFEKLDKNNTFINFIDSSKKIDFFSIKNTNNINIKIFNHFNNEKIIIVTLIDNLIKGASGQAVQCFNLLMGYKESLSLK